MGLNQKINKNLKTHTKGKKDGASQIYKAKGGVPKTVSWGRTTGEARETGWGQLHKVLYNLFQSLFCFNHYRFHHPSTLGVPYTILRNCQYFVTSNS